MLRFVLQTLRWLLGAVFIFSATTKFIDPVGTSLFVDNYLATYSLEALLPASVALGVALSVAEFTLGTMLVVAVARRVVALLSLLIVAIFTVVTLLSATILPIGECGCFGEVVSLTPWGTFVKNVVLLFVAFIVWRTAERGHVCRRDVVVLILAVALSLGINLYALNHQPLVDLMPYKVGTDLRSDVAKEREAEMSYSVLQFRNMTTGAIEEFPADATACWLRDDLEYVDVVTHTTSADSAKYSDFRVYDTEGEDVSERLLSRAGRVAWITVYDAEAIDDECREAIHHIYDLYPSSAIVVLSAVADVDATLFPDTDIYSIDAKTLRSINRAKVGVVVVNDGIVEYKDSL